MAKISELVKTYRLLSDPNAPDWNVKFIGGIVLALGLVAAAGALVWAANSGEEHAATTPAATAPADPADPKPCTAQEVAAEIERLGVTSLPPGHPMPSGCAL